MHFSWSSCFSCKTQQTCKNSTENGPEMKHIPLSLGLCLQKRRGKFICAGVKPYSSSPPIAMRSKVREGSIPRHAAGAWGQGDTGDQAANGAVLTQSDGDPILSFCPWVPRPLHGQRDGGGPWQRHYSLKHTQGEAFSVSRCILHVLL